MMRVILLSLVLAAAVMLQGPKPCHDFDQKNEPANCHCQLAPDPDGRCVIRHEPEGSATRCIRDCQEQAYCLCHADMCERGPRTNDFKVQQAARR